MKHIKYFNESFITDFINGKYKFKSIKNILSGSKKAFLSKNIKKDDILKIVETYSDVFCELDDLGAWLGYDDGSWTLKDLEGGKIKTNEDMFELTFEIKTHITGPDIVVENNDIQQRKIYKYLKDNFKNLCKRFEKLSNCKTGEIIFHISLLDGRNNMSFIKIENNIFGYPIFKDIDENLSINSISGVTDVYSPRF